VGFTRAFRAVGEEEYEDILATGEFRPGPNSLEGKWFADSLEGAKAHGNVLYPDGNFRLVEADLPNDARSLFRLPNLDGKGPARYLTSTICGAWFPANWRSTNENDACRYRLDDK
jgi:hypothetical protein